MSNSHHDPIIRVIDEDQMPSYLDRLIRRGLCTCFPADCAVFSTTRAWHGSAPAYSVLIEGHDAVIAHAGIVDRTIKVADRPLRVAGIQNVFVLPEHRGTGLGDAVMRRSLEEAAACGFDCGLLFCVPELQKLYARSGWAALGQREVVRIDETGTISPLPGKNIAMFFPLRIGSFPSGQIHLQGNDW